jgi:hypothetical protein
MFGAGAVNFRTAKGRPYGFSDLDPNACLCWLVALLCSTAVPGRFESTLARPPPSPAGFFRRDIRSASS